MAFVAGTTLSAAALNAALGLYSMRAENNSGQTIGTSYTTLTGWTSIWDDFPGFVAATGIFTVQAGQAGRYQVMARVSWLSSSTRRLMAIVKNASTEVARAEGNPASNRLTQTCWDVVDLAVGDTLKVQALAGTSTTLDTTGVAPQAAFYVRWIG